MNGAHGRYTCALFFFNPKHEENAAWKRRDLNKDFWKTWNGTG